MWAKDFIFSQTTFKYKGRIQPKYKNSENNVTMSPHSLWLNLKHKL